MTHSTSHPISASDARDSIEARLGLLLAGSLNERVAALPHDISERLRVSREQAVARARQARLLHKPASAAVIIGRGGAAALGGGPQAWWLQFASWAPLAVLIAGLVLIQQWSDREQVLAAAEIDAVLLADDLPPDAYTDPGFSEYLKAPRP